jgi:hypothetical protein
MSLENFLDNCFPHGPCLSSISYNVSPLISHII